jgi:hypothetical protein
MDPPLEARGSTLIAFFELFGHDSDPAMESGTPKAPIPAIKQSHGIILRGYDP